MISCRFTEKAQASRKKLPAEVQLGLLDVLDLLCQEPKKGNRLPEAASTRLYQHDEPPLEITYKFDEGADEIVFQHFSVTYMSLVRSVFMSYSHADKPWLARIRKKLRPFEVIGALKIWADTDITAGIPWEKVLQDQLDSAKAAFLLVSPSFLGSDYVREEELPIILEEAERQERDKRGMKLLWVLVRECDWRHDPHGAKIGRYQAIIDPSTPLEARGADIDRTLEAIQERIAEALAIRN